MPAADPHEPLTPRDADDNVGLFSPLFADGRPLLALGSLGLLLAGAFALFLAATGDFLPHDVAYLGMTPQQLCALHGCRVVHFMIHDRVSFGGALVALATLYLWLIHFPLRHRQAWAWWTLLVSVIAGFLSFLTYLGFGYLDTWHGLATLALLPCFAGGLALAYRRLDRPRGIASLLRPGAVPPPRSRASRGRMLMLGTAAAMVAAGLTITALCMTEVFVPQDLEYMGTTPAELAALNPRLIPLIAHDRAGFGGAVLNVGLVTFACARYAAPSRHRWQALALAGAVGFGCAIGIHPLVGYNNPVHLAPACVGAVAYFIALGLMWRGKSAFV
ncbi:MAG TPA: hypothetical protein VK986_01105 [Tepidisphaeraceae bacterium]|nr:hypothetical protein [Tepidisphaeraceae bacterium]